MEPCHCKVLNLQGFEFGVIDRDTADRQPPNGQCADRECANCDRADRGGDRSHRGSSEMWTTEILLYPPSQTDAAQVPHDYRCRSTSSHRIAFRSLRDNPMCARHPFRSYDAHQMLKNSTTPLMIKRTDNPVKDLFVWFHFDVACHFGKPELLGGARVSSRHPRIVL